MTLDEAIKHAEEVASRKFDDNVHCIKCAEEHRQLAEWLKDYKRLKEQKQILDEIRAEIERQEKWLMDAGYNAYNVDIAFDAIKSVVKGSEVEK